METKQMIADGKTALGIEFGSTRIKVVFLSAVWYTGQAVKILKKQKAVLSEKRTKRRNEVYYGFSKNERGRRGWKDHSWY